MSSSRPMCPTSTRSRSSIRRGPGRRVALGDQRFPSVFAKLAGPNGDLGVDVRVASGGAAALRARSRASAGLAHHRGRVGRGWLPLDVDAVRGTSGAASDRRGRRVSATTTSPVLDSRSGHPRKALCIAKEWCAGRKNHQASPRALRVVHSKQHLTSHRPRWCGDTMRR